MTYDFSNLIMVINSIIHNDGKATSRDMLIINRELDKFTGSSMKCKSVIYNQNTDGMFFGMCVYPDVTPYQVMNIITDSKENSNTVNYVIEFDSRLFDGTFTSGEIVAMILHEVGHVNSEVANRQIKEYINAYFANAGKGFSIDDIKKCPELLVFMYKRSIRAITSIFNKQAEEFEADRFCVEYGFGRDLESSFAKILQKRSIFVEDKFANIKWYLITYNQLTVRKKAVNKLLEEMKNTTKSKLDIELFKNLKDALSKKSIVNEAVCADQLRNKVYHLNESSSLIRKIKLNGMKAIEDETFMYAIRIKNVDSENEAMDILIDINSKLNIVNDYINNEKLDDYDFKRWDALRVKLNSLREDLMKKPAYRQKYYGLFVEYPLTSRGY